MPKSLSSYALYLLITVLIISLYLGNFTGMQKVQWAIDDFMYTFRGESTSAPDVVLVNVDDASCRQLGDWPWSYDRLADLVATCNTGKPRAILLNLDLFARASEDTSGKTQILANQVSWAENIVLTYDIALAEYADHRMSRPEYLYQHSLQVNSELGLLEDNQALNVRRPFLPSSIITQYADGLGFTYMEYDRDRTLRWAPLLANYDGYYYPSAALLTAALYLGYGPNDIKVDGGRAVRVGTRVIPTDKLGRVFINYGSPGKTFTEFSVVDMLQERISPQGLKDKLVIIGVTQGGAAETHRTPVASSMSRSEVLANLIDNIVHNNYISRVDFSSGLNLLVLIGFGLFCAIILPRITLLYRMVVLFGCLFILVNLNFILFNSYSVLLRSLYLGLEIIFFMLASPLLDDSRLQNKGLFGLQRILKPAEIPGKLEAIGRTPRASIPVRTLRDTGAEQEFQKTEHIISDQIPIVTRESNGHETPPRVIGMKPVESEPPAMPVRENRPDASALASKPPEPPYPVENVTFPKPVEGAPLSASPLSGSSGDIDRITNLGRYQVMEVIGKGAMGTVFKGVDPAINRLVALKTIRLDFVTDQAEMEDLRDRLTREARAAGKLSHPNIVTIYDIGAENNLHYIAMEYLEGQTLDELIKRKVQFSYRIVANIISQICMALQYAHDQGIVHRDIKPANIMVLPDYSIKVMDFGIARVDSSSMTRTGVAMGTPNYIAPELLQGKSVDRRCDIFSLGVVLYEVLTGRRPFKGENLTALIYSIINEEPPAPSRVNENIPPIFDHVTMKALKKNPLERFQKATDLQAALADFVGSFGGVKKVSI